MILTVTLNAAIDDTYEVPGARFGEVNRVETVHRRPGGKGVNVARVLHGLGREVVAAGLAGGAAGRQIEEGLDSLGVPAAFTPVAGESRRTVTIVGGGVTMFTEPGPVVTAAEWAAFRDGYAELARDAAAVVLSGSLPPGVPPDAYAVLARLVPGPVILDADGEALRLGLAGRPDVVKPNADELARVSGTGDTGAGIRALREAGARTVVASLGADGLVAATPEGVLRAALDRPVAGNPTGAGDALVAGLAAGIADGLPWPDRLRRAVALAACAVRSPVAGEIDAAEIPALIPHVTLRTEENHAARPHE
ncbi:1-phosphofructokinase family hexose kinase [Actinomadura madurae]|uniref:1-phosphofructokinase family hexose kinase n=1 Tax=Actinomadura madurae TaxID=1993 RepID=UPI002025C10D|nr:1-phosphofructokinase family hexose kinase [Actinomadura madurae]URM94067.1 1-phosphofructokinase family hexose kinase [Actinomadura madurae]